jgi:hypothetical protein
VSIDALKYISIAAMLIDHTAYLFIENDLLYIVMRFIGRLSAPLMFYAAAEGYHHTNGLFTIECTMDYIIRDSGDASKP